MVAAGHTAEEPRHRPTMRDVAALSGVSLKTVSRVVNLEPGVSDELAERVRAAARALDYQPNLTASNLRRSDGKTQTIALLLENVANPYSSALQRAIEDVAREHDVMVFAGSIDEDPERERDLTAAFISRRVDGLIITPAAHDHSYLATEKKSGTSLVFVDRPPSLLEADAVVTDNRAGALQAVSHLIDHGHRRIAYLGDLASINTAVERLSGYTQALERAQIGLDLSLVRQDIRTSEQAQSVVADVLTMPEPPTAIFASQNLITIGAIRELRARDLHRQIALVGFDELPLVDLIEPGITLVLQDVAGIGRTAAELLFRRIAGDDSPSQRCVLPTQLVEGGSGEVRGPFSGQRNGQVGSR